MNITIIGTSNSVLGRNGYIKSLEIKHKVVNISSGRNPVFYHIENIVSSRDLIESSDLLLLDFFSNVGFFDIENYQKHVINMLEIASAMNVVVVNLMFPVKDMAGKFEAWYKFVVDASEECQIPMLDLNMVNFPNECFLDNIHINKKTSYLLGFHLSSEFEKIAHLEVQGGDILSLPYEFFQASTLFDETNRFENSLVGIDYKFLCGGESIDLKIDAPSQLICISYFNEKGVPGALSINGKEYALHGDLYFVETTEDFIKVEDSIKIEAVKFKGNLKSLMNRGDIVSMFNGFNFVSLGLYNFSDVNIIKANRSKVSFELSSFGYFLLMFNEYNDEVSGKSLSESFTRYEVDAVRDAAIMYESKDINHSYLLMSVAKKCRPDGDFILRKYNYYKNIIGDK